MKIIIILAIITLNTATTFGQCINQVSNTTGTANVNGILVSVTSSGIAGINPTYCNNVTTPYYIGYSFTSSNSGNGSYTFNFSPAIATASLNFSGISNSSIHIEEVKLSINGVHYQIPVSGIANNCDALADLTPNGDITGCSGCSLSGWKGTVINGPIYSLSVTDTLISGNPGGSLFSLFICNSVPTNSNQNEIKTNYQLFPNPFISDITVQTNRILTDASLQLYNSYGDQIKQIKNISGQTITLYRDNLPSGLYFIRLTQNNKIILTEKVIITNL